MKTFFDDGKGQSTRWLKLLRKGFLKNSPHACRQNASRG